MDWKAFKDAVEALGVTDTTNIDGIDVQLQNPTATVRLDATVRNGETHIFNDVE